MALSLLFALALAAQQHRGEEVLARFMPSSGWGVAFERDARGHRTRVRTYLGFSAGTWRAALPSEADLAVGISFPAVAEDLAEFEELHLWVRSGHPLFVQPFTQSSGFLFRDGGYPDTRLPGSEEVVPLRIRRDSIADPAMVQSIGIQVRPGRAPLPDHLELLAVTAIRFTEQEVPVELRITQMEAPSAGSLFGIYSASFRLSRTCENPYDPAEIDVRAEFELPSGRRIEVPAFWFQDYTVAPGTEKYEQYEPTGAAHWEVRFLAMETGTHRFRVRARDRAGNTEEAGPFQFEVGSSRAYGPVGRHLSNPLLLQHANGTPYLPRGHNLCFEDGNPELNGTAYYAPLLAGFATAGENWTRLWMTDFARTTLEWGGDHFSGFYSGAGIYSQRAAWRVDRFLDLAAENRIQVQLVLNDHGQFSSHVNARWDSGNPYGSAQGGPVPQASPELFFSNPTARELFRRRLRYVIARWSAYPNLLAWELWNEAQFAGSALHNFQNDSVMRAAVVDWHGEMSEFLKKQDPFGHLVTTSSDDPGYSGWSQIWNLPSVDLVQSHHYLQPASARDACIREYSAAAQQAYGKPVIIAEMGIKASSAPECNFDPEGYLANVDVPAQERTVANRDHLKAGTILRNGIWAAAMTRSGAMNWWWGCYLCPDERRGRRAPEFPLNQRLFPALAAFWGGENMDTPLRESALATQGEILAYGLQDRSRAYFWVRDTREAYGSGWGPAAVENRRTEGAALKLSGLDPGSYVVSLHETVDDGNVVGEFTAVSDGSVLEIPLPSFAGDMALKVSDGTERTWGIVPRSARAWASLEESGSVKSGYCRLHPLAGSPALAAGAMLTFVQSGNPTSDVMVPALRLTRTGCIPAEIGAPSDVGLALANPGTLPASAQLQLFDSEGQPQEASTLSLPPGAHTARFLNQLFPEARTGFRGSVRLTSDVPLGILTLRGTHNQRREFVLTTLPAHQDQSPEIRESLIMAQVVDGGGYQTEWLLLNPYDVPLSGKVRTHRSDGTPWTVDADGTPAAERDYRIAPRGLVRWLSSGSPVLVEDGHCVLAPGADPAPVAAAVIRFAPGGLQSETGVPFMLPAASGVTCWESGAETYTGVAFSNISEQTRRILIELFLRSGIERKLTAEIELEPWRHVARLLPQLFPDLPAAGRGLLRYSADGAIGFLALQIRGTARGEKLTSSLMLGNVPDDAERVFPQVVSGGGYRTRFILLNPGDSTAEGRMVFHDSTGAPSRLLLTTY